MLIKGFTTCLKRIAPSMLSFSRIISAHFWLALASNNAPSVTTKDGTQLPAAINTAAGAVERSSSDLSACKDGWKLGCTITMDSSKMESVVEHEQQVVDASSEIDWTVGEERKAKMKVDCSLLPLLFLGLLVFQLDRMNLASALTDNFAKDIGVTLSTINLGNQILFLGIVVFEVPFNMLLQRLGPRKWLSLQILAFGFLSTMQVFVKNRASFLATRMLLGLCEAGYIPGASYTLSIWYKKSELARRIAILFFGMFGGNALSPILASGILQLGGERGIKGWQYLFLIEGLFTISISFTLLLFLPGSPEHPRPMLTPGIIRFTSRERDILRRIMLDSDVSEDTKLKHISARIVFKTFMKYERWPHYISTFCVFSTWAPLTTYTPSIIMALGFSRVSANALASVGAFLTLLVVFLIAYMSDETGMRGISVIFAIFLYLIALIIGYSLEDKVGKWPKWGLWTLVNAFAVGYHPSHNSWVQLKCSDPRERNVAVAMWVMFAISGLMAGTQYFRPHDSPFYRPGLRTLIILVTVGLVSAIAQELIYVVQNWRSGARWKNLFLIK